LACFKTAARLNCGDIWSCHSGEGNGLETENQSHLWWGERTVYEEKILGQAPSARSGGRFNGSGCDGLHVRRCSSGWRQSFGAQYRSAVDQHGDNDNYGHRVGHFTAGFGSE